MERKLQILQRVNLLDEAFVLLYRSINKDDMEEAFERNADNYSNNMEEYNEKYHLIQSIYTDVKSHFSDRRERIEYLFKDRNADFLSYAALSVLWDFNDYDKALKSYDAVIATMEERKKVRFYASLIDLEEYLSIPKEELNNLADLIAFLEKSSLDSEVKWEVVKIFNNQEAFYNEVHSLLAETIELLESRHMTSIQILERTFCDYWMEYQEKKDIIETIKDKLKISWEFHPAGTVVLPYLLQPFSVALSMDAEELSKPNVLRIGIMMNENFTIITDKQIKKEDVVNIGKLLGDRSKVDILELVGQRPCYGKELANELKLSTATISYHVNSLLAEGLLKAEVNSNKVYYSLNREVLAASIEILKKYFLPL